MAVAAARGTCSADTAHAFFLELLWCFRDFEFDKFAFVGTTGFIERENCLCQWFREEAIVVFDPCSRHSVWVLLVELSCLTNCFHCQTRHARPHCKLRWAV